jgi:UDP-N-acetylmuramate--alanine ligase
MLHFEPEYTIITSLDYDHPDTYPTKKSYVEAFVQFIEQSGFSYLWGKDRRHLDVPDIAASYEAYDELMDLSEFTLPGIHMRQNAYLVSRLLEEVIGETVSHKQILHAINSFPGTSRRFEKLADNLYSDYGHHPVEIAATLQMAREISNHVVLAYQPHQNLRQHEIRDQYTDCMQLAESIYWLPTYLSRENPELNILSPEQLTENLTNRSSVRYAELNDKLWQDIQDEVANNKLVLLMGAGSIDAWAREKQNR